MLAYWTGRDPERVDRLFRASALMRPKWDRSIGEGKLYGTTTVMFAVNTTTTVYEPSPAPPPASQPPQRHNPHGERDSGTSASATTTPGVADENGRKPAPGATCGVVAATGAQRGGAELLDDVRAFIARFVVMSNHQRVAVALWAAHTHAMEAAESTPYLDVTSAEKRSGKTRLFETLELLVPRPLRTANISVAALFRLVAEEGPTVFVDEVDAIFKRGRGGDPSQEELRALINAGHRRGAEAVRMVGQGAGMFAKRFPVFGAKALAGIGELPDTIADRGIPIRLRRATPGERRERFRRRRVEPEGHVLRDGLAAWLEPLLDTLVEADPALPEALGDRAADGWEPLFAIADAAGGEWPALAREAAVALADDGQEASDSLGVRLLADIREVFGADDRVTSVNLASRLAALEESPWGDLYGKALDARGLARRLKPYGVSPRTIRLDDGSTPKGYKREQFEDAWARYCPTEGGAS